jgi:hypothetical protein
MTNYAERSRRLGRALDLGCGRAWGAARGSGGGGDDGGPGQRGHAGRRRAASGPGPRFIRRGRLPELPDADSRLPAGTDRHPAGAQAGRPVRGDRVFGPGRCPYLSLPHAIMFRMGRFTAPAPERSSARSRTSWARRATTRRASSSSAWGRNKHRREGACLVLADATGRRLCAQIRGDRRSVGNAVS